MSFKVKIKSLKQVEYDIEVASDTSKVLELKQAIDKKLEIDPLTIKLLFNGIVLENDKTLAFYNIKEGSMMIFMTSKPVVNKAEEKKEVIKKTNSEQNNNDQKIAENAKKINEEKYATQITQLMEMGFEQSQCLLAINAANGSIPIAIEYLYNGIPPNLGGVSTIVQEPVQYSGLYDNYDDPSDGEGPDDGGYGFDLSRVENLDLNDPNALSNIATVVRVLIKTEGGALVDLLEYLEEANPEIVEFIRNNQEQFNNLVSQPVTEEDYVVFRNLMGADAIPNINQLPSNNQDDSEEDIYESIMTQNQFSSQDREAINFLMSMGFSKDASLEAYIACDKNQELALEYLFKNN